MAVERGEIKRLIISLGPRHGKSFLCSEFFPAWCFGRNPERRFIAASYGQELANDFGGKVRDLLASDVHADVFPGSCLSGSSKAKRAFSTSAGGTYFGVGIGGPLTGRGADILLIDDPIKNDKEAESALIRERHKEWYRRTAYTRLMPNGAVVIIMTRWNEDDLVGWLLREHADEGWVVLSLPAIAEDNDVLGRAPGEALWPSRYPVEVLRAIQATLGERGFASLYQGRPTPLGGGVLKTIWWKYYNVPQDPRSHVQWIASFDEIVSSWDCSFKDTAGSDYVAGGVWGRKGRQYYALDLVWARMDFVATLGAVQAMADKWPQIRAHYIEDKANGPAVISALKGKLSRVIPVDPQGGKVARVNAIAPLVEAGDVFLPRGAPWVDGLVTECEAFPNGAHDDRVDQLSQALARLDQRPKGGQVPTRPIPGMLS